MDRRTYLQSVGVTLGVALAGCSDGEDGPDGGDGSADGNGSDGSGDAPRVYNVNAVSPVTEDGPFATTLRVEWAYRSQSVVDPDEAGERPAPDQTQFLVCQFRVENVGDAATPVVPGMFQLAAPNTENVFERLSFEDPDQFPVRRLDPDDVATGWVAFHVPQLQDEMVLALEQDVFPEPVDATFERADLAFTLNDDDSRTTVPGATTATEVAV